MFNRIVAIVLAAGAVILVLLLAGFGSSVLTDDPPQVDPYAAGVEAAVRLVVAGAGQ